MARVRLRLPAGGERLAMLDEGVQIMRQAWETGTATLDGEHYQVDGAICRPLPLQEGGIPLWIAGGGEKKTLRIAAQHARYTNFDGTPETFRHKSEVLAGHCRDLGTDYDAIVRSANYNVLLGRDDAEVRDQARRRPQPVRLGARRGEGRRGGRRPPGRPARWHPRAGRGAAHRGARRRHDLCHLLLPAGGHRPLRDGACSSTRWPRTCRDALHGTGLVTRR
ncbi:hypothetical protein GCM10025868_36050 [Angustibacter aerolatus]|uniref:Luciferase-like domain-containing protein n=1 Tax=Angustibacter aerolatus TaxID=1162965 RepID=A0ABQ6JM82_9ACTN|nr:hypothetical protein GCM10025868_36050 [Angustibacter aerolatus]